LGPVKNWGLAPFFNGTILRAPFYKTGPFYAFFTGFIS